MPCFIPSVLARSTILPDDVEIGSSSSTGLVMLANISEKPAALLAIPSLSSEFVDFDGGAGLGGGGPGLAGG